MLWERFLNLFLPPTSPTPPVKFTKKRYRAGDVRENPCRLEQAQRQEEHAAPTALARRPLLALLTKIFVSKNVKRGEHEPQKNKQLPAFACSAAFPSWPFLSVVYYPPSGSCHNEAFLLFLRCCCCCSSWRWWCGTVDVVLVSVLLFYSDAAFKQVQMKQLRSRTAALWTKFKNTTQSLSFERPPFEKKLAIRSGVSAASRRQSSIVASSHWFVYSRHCSERV